MTKATPPIADRIWSELTVGGSGSDPKRRRVHNPTLEKRGWKAWIEESIRPQIAQGYHQFMVVMPGGFTGPFEMGQMLHAKRDVPWLYHGFESAFLSLKRKYQVRIGIYLGSGVYDPELDESKTTAADRWAFREKAMRQFLTVADVLAFDALTGVPEGSEQFHYIKALSTSHEIYGEGYPDKSNPWTAGHNVYTSGKSLSQRFDGNNQHRAEDGGWGVPEADVKGEIVALYDGGTPEGVVPFAKEHLAAGRSVSLPVYDLVARGIAMSELA